MDSNLDSNLDRDLIGHWIEHMTSKECAIDFLRTILDANNNVVLKQPKKSDNYEKLAELAQNLFKDGKLKLSKIRELSRKKWCDEDHQKVINFHWDNLTSGKLGGHDWHGTIPSHLHLGMQGLVRKCRPGDLTLDQLIGYGEDIMKQEYFITATHDIIENAIIKTFDNVIPEIEGHKSITDFIINDTPVDLKVSSYPDSKSIDKINNSSFASSFSVLKMSKINKKMWHKILHN